MNKENAILFLGDVAPYRPYKFKNTYRTVINLECPITKVGNPATGKIILGAKDNHLKSIFNSNLIAVNVGNNHILDFGSEGVDSTIMELEKSGITYFGLNSIDDNNPRIIEFDANKIALISATCESTSPILEHNNVNYLSAMHIEDIITKVRKIRELVHRVVVYIHWGVEESSYPEKNDVLIARKLIDEGVDIVIGSHAHAPQAVEKYKKGIIAHNLGNFIMPVMENVPSYFDEKGIPQSAFTSRAMLWNRISWGLIIDMETLEFRIKKYMLFGHRVIELPFTPLDKYLKLNKNIFNDTYESIFLKHIKRRKFQRKIIDFLYNPHVPQKLKRKL
jgi:2',3'-cyclic-nucleotide 2'-phosphodiesterase (5'-nucleotidase family)